LVRIRFKSEFRAVFASQQRKTHIFR
jgi:hypothetical protein